MAKKPAGKHAAGKHAAARASPIDNGRQPGPRADFATRFQPGNPGGPGRPQGSRNKLEEDMLAAFCADWRQHGAQAIADMRERSPGDYVKVAVQLLPRESRVEATVRIDPNELSDAELAAAFASNGRAGIAEAQDDPSALH